MLLVKAKEAKPIGIPSLSAKTTCPQESKLVSS